MEAPRLDRQISDLSRVYILRILYEGSCHGYHIISRLRSSTRSEVTPRLVYPFLQLLRRRRLVSTKLAGKRTRKVYGLTEEGKEVCVRLFERIAVLVSTAIEPSLKVCANCGCMIRGAGYNEMIKGEMATFCCKHCAISVRQEKRIEVLSTSGSLFSSK